MLGMEKKSLRINIPKLWTAAMLASDIVLLQRSLPCTRKDEESWNCSTIHTWAFTWMSLNTLQLPPGWARKGKKAKRYLGWQTECTLALSWSRQNILCKCTELRNFWSVFWSGETYFVHKPVVDDHKKNDDQGNNTVWWKLYLLLKTYSQGKFLANPLLNTLGGGY